MKDRKLLLLPVLFLVFYGSDRLAWGRAAIWALFATLVLTMVLTYTNFFQWTAIGPMHGNDDVTRQWVFKDHISGGLMMAFLVCLSMALARSVRRDIARWALYGVALLALLNVLLVLKGRTGQVVAIGYMVIYVFLHLFHFKHQDKRTRWLVAIAALAGCVCLVSFALMAKHSRLAETGQEISQFETYNKETSVGVRLEFYRRSSELILMRPVAGFGVGSVRTEFELLSKNSTGGRAAMAGNPHNEFFLMGVQIGLIGVALFIWFLIAIERECRKLQLLERTVAYGYLFAFVLGCFANSLLLNFTEGNLFVFLMGILLFSGRRRDDLPLPADIQR
jgi:O-antigen ligase